MCRSKKVAIIEKFVSRGLEAKKDDEINGPSEDTHFHYFKRSLLELLEYEIKKLPFYCRPFFSAEKLKWKIIGKIASQKS